MRTIRKSMAKIQDYSIIQKDAIHVYVRPNLINSFLNETADLDYIAASRISKRKSSVIDRIKF